MSSPQPPPIPVQDQTSLRRHHTISTSSRTSRAHPRIPISEVDDEDEVVGDDWTGGVGAVGEGKGLHRQHSLPSKYNNRAGFRSSRHAQSGTLTPSRAVNSLSAITSEHGGDAEGEEEWERDLRGWRHDDDEILVTPNNGPAYQSAINHERSLSQSSHSSSIAAAFSPPPSDTASPPPPMDSGPVAAAGAAVRRHQSLTHGAGGGARLMRSATGGKNMRTNSRMHAVDTVEASEIPYHYSEEVSDREAEEPEAAPPPVANTGNGRVWGSASAAVGNSNATGGWGQPQPQQYQQISSDDLVEDVQRTLAGMELGPQTQGNPAGRSNQYGGYFPSMMYATGQTLAQPAVNPTHQASLTPPATGPPRFRSPSPNHSTATESALSSLINAIASPPPSQLYVPPPAPAGRPSIGKLSLVTDLRQSGNQFSKQGPVSAAAYVPPIGGGLPSVNGPGSSMNNDSLNSGGSSASTVIQGNRDREKPLTASGLVWEQKDRIVGSRNPHPNNNNNNSGFQSFNPAEYLADPSIFSTMDPSLQQQLQQHFYNQAQLQQLQQQQQQQSQNAAMGRDSTAAQMNILWQQMQLLQQQIQQQQQQQENNAPHGQYAQPQPHSIPSRLNTNLMGSGNAPAGGVNTRNGGAGGFLGSPVDVPSLVASKGYNPTTFDIRPAFARYFVIKSYTEDDVHKSLKYEIWSSTDPGNKRLDKAFKECNGRGPIYLFFSVNASGHFCGMAEMLTPVDYTRSSTVWAQDKWKGVFKVRWIFVRDIANSALRHIRLTNTQERKPVTNSRDTQELLPDAGHEMLRIFYTHPSRTSLLQDFAFYELQSMQKVPQQPPSQTSTSHPSQSPSPNRGQLSRSPAPPSNAASTAALTAALQQQQLQLQLLQQQLSFSNGGMANPSANAQNRTSPPTRQGNMSSVANTGSGY